MSVKHYVKINMSVEMLVCGTVCFSARISIRLTVENMAQAERAAFVLVGIRVR